MSDSQSSSDLLGFVSSLGGNATRVEERLGEGYVRLRVSEAERRQAKHDIRCIEDVVIELLRNSRDAGARRIFVATYREGTKRTLVVLDDGQGIPRDMWERVFDARVTSKLDSVHLDRWGVHGRGMALFSIRENVERAEVVDSVPGLGTSLRIVSDTGSLAERADQSTWPEVRGQAEKPVLGKGPHNIIRTCCEFALEEDACNVYVGSPAEIIATVRRRIPAGDPSLRSNDSGLGMLGRLANASGPHELAGAALSLGLNISERTAQRIVSSEIAPLSNVRRVLARNLRGKEANSARVPSAGALALKLSPRDASELAQSVGRDFNQVAERYYVQSVGQPEVRIKGNTAHITIQFQPNDEEY